MICVIGSRTLTCSGSSLRSAGAGRAMRRRGSGGRPSQEAGSERRRPSRRTAPRSGTAAPAVRPRRAPSRIQTGVASIDGQEDQLIVAGGGTGCPDRLLRGERDLPVPQVKVSHVGQVLVGQALVEPELGRRPGDLVGPSAARCRRRRFDDERAAAEHDDRQPNRSGGEARPPGRLTGSRAPAVLGFAAPGPRRTAGCSLRGETGQTGS